MTPRYAGRRQGEEFARGQQQTERETHTDGQNHECQQGTELFAAQLLARAGAELRADHAAREKQECQDRVDRLVLNRSGGWSRGW